MNFEKWWKQDGQYIAKEHLKERTRHYEKQKDISKEAFKAGMLHASEIARDFKVSFVLLDDHEDGLIGRAFDEFTKAIREAAE